MSTRDSETAVSQCTLPLQSDSHHNLVLKKVIYHILDPKLLVQRSVCAFDICPIFRISLWFLDTREIIYAYHTFKNIQLNNNCTGYGFPAEPCSKITVKIPLCYHLRPNLIPPPVPQVSSLSADLAEISRDQQEQSWHTSTELCVFQLWCFGDIKMQSNNAFIVLYCIFICHKLHLWKYSANNSRIYAWNYYNMPNITKHQLMILRKFRQFSSNSLQNISTCKAKSDEYLRVN